nr:MAG: ORF1 [TTV-like mini virus]
MPYYWRQWRRPRRFWRRRTRKTFRTRYWRTRRRYRRRPVRKRKLKKITIKQWQPQTIRKLTVRGQYPLFAGCTERIANNNTEYIDEIAPEKFPGGGLYSITVFTLQGLYELHLKGRNWWTKSNCNLPLIRYHGCTIKLYNSTNADYVSVAVNCGELKANEKMFQSCQPSVLLLNRKKKVLLCKDYKRKRRPYKIWRIPPPALLYNKWYFQKELANYPLLMLLSSAASLDRYYMSASAISETEGFISLNTDFFKLHNWKNTGLVMYKPQDELYLLTTGSPIHTCANTMVKDMILAANTTEHTLGKTFSQTSTTTITSSNWDQIIQNYLSKKPNWANPFHETIFSQETPDNVCILKVPATSSILDTLKQLKPDKTCYANEQGGKIIPCTTPFTIACRYNPQADMGHNTTFLANITTDKTPWHEPSDEHLITQGFPLWLLLWGWHDYIRKAEPTIRMDTERVQVIVSDYISPKNMTYYLPLDWFFLHGRSPYSDQNHIKPFDQQNWQPKVNFQLQSISRICNTGPATIKLPEMVSCEGHITYKFHFKVGGCPPDMDEVCNPKLQPQYPQPGNLISSILLQNPEQPLQYYINAFDQRRDTLTLRAAKRIKQDTNFKETFSKPTGQTLLDIRPPSPETTSETDSSEEEKSEEETQQLIHQHRRKQRKLQRGILRLLKLTQNLE